MINNLRITMLILFEKFVNILSIIFDKNDSFNLKIWIILIIRMKVSITLPSLP